MIAGRAFPVAKSLKESFERGIMSDEIGPISDHKLVVERRVVASKRRHHQLLLERRHLQCGKVRGSSALLSRACRPYEC